MAIGRYAGIAGIEDFINAGEPTDYYDMYLNAGNRLSALDNLATSTEGAMAANALTALGGYHRGIGEAALAKAQYGKTKPNPFNTALGFGADLAGLAGSFGSGLTTGDPSNVISDPTDTFKSLSGPGGALEGGVYDYWGS